MATDPDVYQPAQASLEERASLALKILAVLNAGGILLAAIPALVESSALQGVVFNVASGALALLYVLVARGLDRGRPWAVSTIRPLLWLMAVWGAFTFTSAFIGGAFRIPLPLLAAGYALIFSANRWRLTRLTIGGGAIMAMTAALIVMELVSQPLFSWGGYFDVHEPDLNASLTVDCGTNGAGLPQNITVSYEWSWSLTTLLPNGEDQLMIGWNGDGVDGHPLYVIAALPDTASGIKLGVSNGVSRDMARAAAAQWRGTYMWRLDLGTLDYRTERIELVLVRTTAQPSQPAHLDVGASYVHLGVWQSNAPTVTCSW
jgi:hypothetical protein